MDESEVPSESDLLFRCNLKCNATAAQIRMALKVWDFPLQAYPGNIEDAKLEWTIPGNGPCGPIAVDLPRQTFVVDLIDGTYYSCWNAFEFPLGAFHKFASKGHFKGHGFMRGSNHTSATDAWLHAQQILHEQLCNMEPAEQVKFLVGKPEPTMFLNRLMIDGVTPVPDDGVPPPAASSVADVITSPEAVRAALGAKEVDEAAMRRPSCGCCTASACCAFGVSGVTKAGTHATKAVTVRIVVRIRVV